MTLLIAIILIYGLDMPTYWYVMSVIVYGIEKYVWLSMDSQTAILKEILTQIEN